MHIVYICRKTPLQYTYNSQLNDCIDDLCTSALVFFFI